MNEKGLKIASEKLRKMITNGDILPYTPCEVETINIFCNEFYYYDVEQKTTPQEKVKDFFVECGFEVKKDILGWVIFNR